MSEIVIEKNIPMPERQHGKWKFLADMEVGDSVLLPANYIKELVSNWRASSQVKRRFPDRLFSARSISNDIRVWRIK